MTFDPTHALLVLGGVGTALLVVMGAHLFAHWRRDRRGGVGHFAPGKEGIDALLDNAPQRVFFKDTHSVYISCNQQYAADLGITPQQIIGKTDFDFYSLEEADKYRADDQWIIETGQTEEFEETRTWHGQQQLVRTIKTPIKNKAGKSVGVLGIFWDITEERRAQHDYHTLFDQMITGFAFNEMIFDESGKPVDYRFLAVNPAFEELTGLRARDIVGRTAKEVLPALEPYWIDTFGDVVLTGQSVHYENYSQSLDRHYEVTAYRPEKGRFVCTFVDVTGRRQAQDALIESERLLAEAQQLAKLGSWEWDFRTDTLTGSAQARCLVGASGPITYKDLVDRIHPDDRERHQEHIRKLKEGDDREPLTIEYRLIHPDGHILWLQGRATLRRDDTGHVTSMFGTLQDITDRVHADPARQQDL